MTFDPKALVPEVKISTNPTEAERILYDNFMQLKTFFDKGITGTFTVGANSIVIEKGIITSFS